MDIINAIYEIHLSDFITLKKKKGMSWGDQADELGLII